MISNRTSTQIAVTSAFLFFVFATLRFAYLHGQQSGMWNPVITCTRPLIDLGNVEANTMHECVFELENRGSQELVIERIRVGCGACMKIIRSPKTIPAKEKRHLEIEYRVMSGQGKTVKKLSVYSNDPSGDSLQLSVQASVE